MYTHLGEKEEKSDNEEESREKKEKTEQKKFEGKGTKHRNTPLFLVLARADRAIFETARLFPRECARVGSFCIEKPKLKLIDNTGG